MSPVADEEPEEEDPRLLTKIPSGARSPRQNLRHWELFFSLLTTDQGRGRWIVRTTRKSVVVVLTSPPEEERGCYAIHVATRRRGTPGERVTAIEIDVLTQKAVVVPKGRVRQDWEEVADHWQAAQAVTDIAQNWPDGPEPDFDMSVTYLSPRSFVLIRGRSSAFSGSVDTVMEIAQNEMQEKLGLTALELSARDISNALRTYRSGRPLSELRAGDIVHERVGTDTKAHLVMWDPEDSYRGDGPKVLTPAWATPLTPGMMRMLAAPIVLRS